MQAGRQVGRLAGLQAGKQADKQRDRLMYGQNIFKHGGMLADGQVDRLTACRHAGRQTKRQADLQAEHN